MSRNRKKTAKVATDAATDTRSDFVVMATIGLIFVMVATLVPLLRIGGELGVPMWDRYLYTAGALMVLVGRIFSPYRGDVLRLKRLHRIESWCGIFFCVAAFFMFYHGYGVGPNDWIAFTLAGAVLQIYTSIMIPHISKKTSK